MISRISPAGPVRRLILVSMDEALAFPNLEASADGGHVEPTGVLYSRRVFVIHSVNAVIDVVAVIDEVNPIMTGHAP